MLKCNWIIKTEACREGRGTHAYVDNITKEVAFFNCRWVPKCAACRKNLGGQPQPTKPGGGRSFTTICWECFYHWNK